LLQGGIGEDKQWEKNKCFIPISLFNTWKTAQRVCFIPECLQYASTTCFIIVWVSSFSPLLGHTRYQGSQSVVSSSRTARPSKTWGGRWIGHWKTTWSTVRSSAPHPQAAEVASGGSWWNWPRWLRNLISGWTYGIVALAFFSHSGVSSHSSSPNLIKLVIFSCPYWYIENIHFSLMKPNPKA